MFNETSRPGWHHCVKLEDDSIRSIDLPRAFGSIAIVDKAGPKDIGDPLAAVGVDVDVG